MFYNKLSKVYLRHHDEFKHTFEYNQISKYVISESCFTDPRFEIKLLVKYVILKIFPLKSQ